MAAKNFGSSTKVVHVGNPKLKASDEEGSVIMERYITLAGIVNFGFTMQAGWANAGLTLSLAFLNGGPAGLVWGAVLGGIGNTMIAMSLGEMASMDPTVGAQYRWSARLARKCPAFWGLLQGWLTVAAWVFSAAGVMMVMATTVQGLIAFWDPNYMSKPWHATLLMWAFLVLSLTCNLFLPRLLNVFETLGGVCHVIFFIAIIIILTTLGERTDASFVFTTLYSGISGWKNSGVCFHLALIVTAGPLSGYDSVLHMIDETKVPRKRVPKSMILSVILNSLMVFAYMLTILFCIGDAEKVTASTNPLIEIFYQATKSKAATTVVVLMHAIIMLVSLFNIVASACRITWAFAKDDGLPFGLKDFFALVSPRFRIPLNALALNSVVATILSLINLGSTTALSAIISLSLAGCMISYFLPVFLITIRKLNGEHPTYGPFKLGRMGLPINLLAICFSAYFAFWFVFPISYPVTTANMNYAGPVFIALVLLVIVDWFTTGKTRFKVPTGPYNIEMGVYDISSTDPENHVTEGAQRATV